MSSQLPHYELTVRSRRTQPPHLPVSDFQTVWPPLRQTPKHHNPLHLTCRCQCHWPLCTAQTSPVDAVTAGTLRQRPVAWESAGS